MTQGEFDREFHDKVLEQMFELWVEPAISERGLDLVRADKAAVIMPPGTAVTVLLNDEAPLVARARAKRPIAAGEQVTSDDLEDVEDLTPHNVDPNAGWIVFAMVGTTSIVSFDFRRNLAAAAELLLLADQYLDVARDALSKASVGPALENAYAAAELAVRAQMLTIDDNPPAAHRPRQEWWEQWVAHGNSPAEHGPILSTLAAARPAGRYGEGLLTLPADQAAGMVDHVADMVATARGRCQQRATLPITG